MDLKEITQLLLTSAKSRDGKYIPWWEDDFSDCDYSDQIFTPEEVQQVEECMAACGADALSAPVGEDGYSIFHLLVWLNFYTAAEQALQAGVDANLTDNNGNAVTPLLLACCRSNFAMVKLLADHGADTAHFDAKGRNGFHYLAHPFAQGLGISENPYYSLSQRKKIAELLSGNADITKKDAQGIAPLVYLVDGGRSMISCVLIDTYLEMGADPYFIDDNGGTLLFRALLRRRATAALRLMEYPELVAQETKFGKTVLMEAMENRDEGLCIALKDHGAKGDCPLAEVDTINLARIANNAFTDAFGYRHDIDQLSLAFYLVKKLIALANEEEDYGCLEGILDDALRDTDAQILDLLHNEGIDFTEPYYGGYDSVSCLRDKCIEYCRNANALKKLASFGVDMERTVIAGRNPACILASRGDCDSQVFRLFSAQAMQERDNSGRAAIHYAVMRKDAEMLSVILAQGVDVNLAQDAPAEAGYTPLHLACIYGRIEAAKLLMAFGADDTITNINGDTPAHCLLLPNHHRSELTTQERKELFMLLDHVDIPGNDGKTPIMLLMSWSIANSDVDVDELLSVLLAKGADANRRDNAGNSVLLLCADTFGGRLKPIKMLCEAGADLNAIDATGNNALYYAFQAGGQNVAKYLLKKGADYNHPNNKGVTPAQIAVEKGYDTLFPLMPEL